MVWKLKLDDHTWDQTELTVDQAIAIEDLIGKGWASIEPATGPRELATMLAVLLSEEPNGPSYGEAMVRVKAMTAAELAACVEET